MSRMITIPLVAPIAAAALALSLSGCGGSSTSSTASSASSATTASATSVSESASAAASPEPGTLAAACPQLDALMGGNPDADPAGTAKKLEDIKAEVTTPDADLIEALAAAYTVIAGDPSVAPDQLSASATALGAACQSATTAPRPN